MELSHLLTLFNDNNIDFVISRNPGTSYCNYLYFKVLSTIKDKSLKTKAIFIHVPFIKNFTEIEKIVMAFNVGRLE